ncbi:hypothetical protein C5167_042194 [Papaver somniferum]|uniref:Uncharacterized protein n=1 Tax=Papaver somniferum TaxID=3469 RepID=A0A4Y7L4R0_PAPSO|nr:hypothetical protein C5167_042194 [Papaver somniferum]
MYHNYDEISISLLASAAKTQREEQLSSYVRFTDLWLELEKVAKQDKEKKPRGKAHKRMQYNRRFLTAVVGFGKKRGPNSSEK